MVYIFRPQFSQGARELAASLNGVTLRRFDGGRFHTRRNAAGVRPVTINGGDVLVCWGATLPAGARVDGVKVLNNAPIRSKLDDALKLRETGVPTIEVSRTRPAQQARAVVDPALELWEDVKEAAEDLLDLEFQRSQIILTGVNELITQLGRLATIARTPAPPPQRVQGEWLPRASSHVGGDDLLHPPATPDFWSRRENLTEEYRIHSFLGKSIRAGRKMPREGFQNPHDWIRSFDAGWRINYDDFKSTKEMRAIAAKAVGALELQFGAVDIGRKADGGLIVLEVNRAPGLEGGTVAAYTRAILGANETI